MARNTGTDYGSTRVASALSCPKKYALYLEHGFGPGTPAQMLGTVVHYLLRRYHAPAHDSPKPEDCDETSWTLGQRVNLAYQGMIKPDQWGKTIAAEQEMIVKAEDSATIALTGWPMLSGRADLVTHVDLAKSDELMAKYDIFVPEGNYIIDYKTAGMKHDWAMQDIMNGLQPLHYAWLWSQLHRESPIAGTIILRLYHYKGDLKSVDPFVKVFDWQMVDGPRFKRMCESIGEVEKEIAEKGAKGNPGACFTGKYSCGMIKRGLCKGY